MYICVSRSIPRKNTGIACLCIRSFYNSVVNQCVNLVNNTMAAKVTRSHTQTTPLQKQTLDKKVLLVSLFAKIVSKERRRGREETKGRCIKGYRLQTFFQNVKKTN